jgi:serine/threonine-protein kinase
MDEFDAITTNPNFDMQFFSFLRFLANNFKVAYVTSSMHDLQQMCHDKEIADSPFFNIFSNLPLRPFSREEATELITLPSEHEGIPLAGHADRILELSGLFPLFIQMACSNAFENIIENDGGEPDWDQVTRSFVDEVTPHYSFVWESMDDNTRSNVVRIASGKAVDKKFHHVSEKLRRLGYLVDVDGRTSIFSRTFADFVLENAGATSSKKSFWGKLMGR